MGLNLGVFTEWMDKIFGGPGEKRGLIQGIVLLVVGIILEAIPSGVYASSILVIDPAQALALYSLYLALGWMNWVGGILVTLGIIGLVWFVLRKFEVIE